MSEVDLTQAEADSLISMEKHRVDDIDWIFPEPGDRLVIPLTSVDRRESFVLDVNRARVKLTKATFQNRARGAVVLLRLDLDGPPHRNPDDEEIPCPHIHFYREGYGTKWAVPLSASIYPDTRTLAAVLDSFMSHCNITGPPKVHPRLF